MAAISAWRTSDAVTFDVMRESATTLIALLLRSGAQDPRTADHARAEIAAWRTDILTVDAYDRAAVAALATRIETRSRELDGETS
ncbi:hypothetical protein LTA6_001878 [Microbacterium sp. LTA6]|uniref:hypothetical protein n=1 Tax=unclassified Microbacterium TaxID=2609290 RepID=UPI00324940E7